MKLKESTFAIIAEKQNSVSHRWFEENLDIVNIKIEWKIGCVYCCDSGYYRISWDNVENFRKHDNRKLYTESEFEALLKAEEFSEICETSKLQPKNTAFGSENIAHKHLKENALTIPKQITISYNLAIEYLADRLNVDKGIIKIEM